MSKLQYISVGDVRYKAEFFKSNIDTEVSNVTGKYVMLRSYAFMNNVLYDTDLYFVEKELFVSYINKKQEKDVNGNENLTSGLIFPVTGVDGIETMTLDIRQFNQDFNPQYFDEHNDDLINSPLVYYLYSKDDSRTDNNSNFTEANIKCSKLRLYRPHTVKDQNIVIHCYSIINNIKVHVLCRDLNWYERDENAIEYTNSVTETSHAHDFYTSYIDIVVPDLDDLFSNNIYYIENLNAGDVNMFDVASKESEKVYERYKNCINGQYMSLSAFTLPFNIEKTDISSININNKESIGNYTEASIDNTILLYSGDNNILEEAVYTKHYYPDLMHTTAQAQQKYALSVCLIPYDNSYKYNYKETNTDASIYDKVVYGFGRNLQMILSDSVPSKSTQFFTKSEIRLKSKLGFDGADGAPAIINIFDYPLKDSFTDFNEAYEFYNGVDLREYTGIVDDEDEDGWYDPDYGENMQCGAVLEIFADKFNKDRLYKESYGFKQSKDGSLTIEDFNFRLDGMFSSWGQWPGTLFIRCTFVDKYLGKKLFGNVCTLTKETFKYLINDTETYKTKTHGDTINKEEIESRKEWESKETLKECNVMDKSRFNFLNNIRVNITVPESNSDTVTTSTNSVGRSTGTKVIYKPVFYRVHDVNSIKLRSGITQNVGINLMNWMTKVETFKIVINTVTLTEYARNDNYVIFNITTDKVTNATSTNVYAGEYHVLNQDDEYITSGQWAVQ